MSEAVQQARPRPRLLVATDNAAKVRALAEAIGGAARVGPLPRRDISHETPTESAPSLEAIATNKARQASIGWRRELVVATDGGLLVPALGTVWDPVRTRRFAGEGASNRERADALLTLAAGLEGEERRIGWREALAVARDGEVLAVWVEEGPPGLLARDVDPAAIEQAGFWVPALWLCPEYGNRRLTDLAADERAARDDHWARLGRHLRRFLEALPGDDPSPRP